MTDEMIERLKVLAKKKVWDDKLTTDGKCIVDDFAGGNVDDAYGGGYESGLTVMARDVLNDLGISYE